MSPAEPVARDRELAARLLALVDLTDLGDTTTPTATDALCERALTAAVRPAALCVWPRFVARARANVGAALPIATVLNFPAGDDAPREVLAQLDGALRDGADELDLVAPWRAFMSGDTARCAELIADVKARAPGHPLKVIVESGEHPSLASLRALADLALHAGADLLKTSTGKSPVGATLPAARCLLEAARDAGGRAGFKASGGIRTQEQAAAYLSLFESIARTPATAARFRIGASALFDVLLADLATDR